MRMSDETAKALDVYASSNAVPKRAVIEHALTLELRSPQPSGVPPSSLPKVVKTVLPLVLADAFDEHVRSRKLIKGYAIDRAIARVIGLPCDVIIDAQGAFHFSQDSALAS